MSGLRRPDVRRGRRRGNRNRPRLAGRACRGSSGPSIPSADGEGVSWTMALMGGIGGTVTVLSYGYWIREEGRQGAGEIRTCRIDLAVGYAMTGLFGLGMVIIGSELLDLDGDPNKGTTFVLEPGEAARRAAGSDRAARPLGLCRRRLGGDLSPACWASGRACRSCLPIAGALLTAPRRSARSCVKHDRRKRTPLPALSDRTGHDSSRQPVLQLRPGAEGLCDRRGPLHSRPGGHPADLEPAAGAGCPAQRLAVARHLGRSAGVLCSRGGH